MTHAVSFHAWGNTSERVQKLDVKTLLDLLNRLQQEKLSCFKARISVIGKIKPTRVIPTDLRLILPEIESIKCACIIFVSDRACVFYRHPAEAGSLRAEAVGRRNNEPAKFGV
jgi:hypothetical protein